MSKSYYQVGNTIKLKGRFGDFEDETRLVSPDQVNLKIYNSNWNQIENVEVHDQDSEGYYTHYYVFDEVGTYYYEWVGLFNGQPSLEREKILIKKV